jgi:translation initiation factor IF-2
MVETTEKTAEKKLSVTPTKALSLKGRGVEHGMVKQSFSHGRTKTVVVEKVRSRTAPKAKIEAPAPDLPVAKRGTAVSKAGSAAAAATTPTAAKPSGVVLRTLTEEEQKARVHALADARLRETEERKIAEEEARVRQQREAVERAEREAAEARKREEDERRRHDEEAKRKAEQEAKKRFGEEEARPKPGMLARTQVAELDEEEAPRARRPGSARPAAAPKARAGGAEKRRPRLTLVTALSADEVREHSKASFVRRTKRRGQ